MCRWTMYQVHMREIAAISFETPLTTACDDGTFRPSSELENREEEQKMEERRGRKYGVYRRITRTWHPSTRSVALETSCILILNVLIFPKCILYLSQRLHRVFRVQIQQVAHSQSWLQPLASELRPRVHRGCLTTDV